MWLVESYGEVKQVEAYPGEEPHARCDPSYKERVLSEMASYGNGITSESQVLTVEIAPTDY